MKKTALLLLLLLALAMTAIADDFDFDDFDLTEKLGGSSLDEKLSKGLKDKIVNITVISPFSPIQIETKKKGSSLEIKLVGHPIQKIKIKKAQNPNKNTLLIDNPGPSGSFKKLYAIDPTQLEFQSAEITSKAGNATALYKCAQWNFTQRTCPPGEWELLKDLDSGKKYKIKIKAGDPAFAEQTDVPDLSLAPIDNETFAIAFIDKGTNKAGFSILKTFGDVVENFTTIDSTSNKRSRITISPINSTHFAIAYIDGPSKALKQKIYSDEGTATTPITTIDPKVGKKNDVAIAPLGNRFITCYANGNDNDADYQGFLNNGIRVITESRVDNNIRPKHSLQNLIGCTAVNSTRWVYAWFDNNKKKPDVSFAILNQNGTILVPEVDVDDDAGKRAQVATTTLDDDKFVVAWFDSKDKDITFEIRYINNTVIAAPTDVDTNVGKESKIALATLRRNEFASEDDFAIVWVNSVSDTIKAAVYSNQGLQVTAPFIVESQQSPKFQLISAIGRVPSINKSICPGKFIVAYSNASKQGIFRGFNSDGSEWSGRCNTPPTVEDAQIAPTNPFVENNVCLTVNITDPEGVKNATATIDLPSGPDANVELKDDDGCNSLAEDGQYSALYRISQNSTHAWTTLTIKDNASITSVHEINLTFNAQDGFTVPEHIKTSNKVTEAGVQANPALTNVSDDIFNAHKSDPGQSYLFEFNFTNNNSVESIKSLNITIEHKFNTTQANATLQIEKGQTLISACNITASTIETKNTCAAEDLFTYAREANSIKAILNITTSNHANQDIDYAAIEIAIENATVETNVTKNIILLNDTQRLTLETKNVESPDLVTANITLPDGTTIVKNLTDLQNGTFTANITEIELVGNYNITAYIFDNESNTRAKNSTSFERVPLNIIDLVSPNRSYLQYSANVQSNLSGLLDIHITMQNNKLTNLTIREHNENSINRIIKLDNIASMLYAIDPEGLNFTNATVEVKKDTGANALYKCANWNFTQKNCTGDWVRLKNISKSKYSILIKNGDPAFAELTEAPDVALAPIDNTSFIIAYTQSNTSVLNIKALYTNGTTLHQNRTVDSTVDEISRVSITPLNNTHFAMAWQDGPEKKSKFQVFYNNLTNSSPIKIFNNDIEQPRDISITATKDHIILCETN
ncbi:hypothetical protein D6825_02735, partial [Candidatus Woesearchaeota archaeon]